MSELRFEGPVPGKPFLMLPGADPADAGYQREEWFVSGSASGYEWEDEGSQASAKPSGEAAFRTRLVVYRPEDPGRFSGDVFVEWLNVSGGVDAAPDFMFLHRHLMRRGDVWIGVSAQKAGIDGGGIVPGMPLKQADAERYGSLEHPGDAYALGLYGAIGRALRSSGEGGPLAGLDLEKVFAIGESQSAGFLVTYVNAVDPIDRGFDGFLIHGRPGSAARIDGRYLSSAPDGDVASSARAMRGGQRLRSDLRVPVLTVQSETDVTRLGSGRARQPDTERSRLWEIAGAAHFDTYGLVAAHVDREGVAVESLAAALSPVNEFMGMALEAPLNAGPQQHYVLHAAVTHLVRWAREGTPPPAAPRLEGSDDEASELARDGLGIARGGIRTPWVEAPSAVLSGVPQDGEGFVFLLGQTRLLEPEELSRLYPGGRGEHLERFEAALEASLSEGFLLAEDAPEIRALARHGQQPSGWAGGERSDPDAG